MNHFNFVLFTILVSIINIAICKVEAVQEEQISNQTSTTRKLFAYAGPLLPNDWTVVTTLNDRAVIGFSNGSARNALMEELELKDKVFLQKLQNGTIYTTPLSSAKEKIAQWSSSVSSTVTKFGKSFKDQFDSLINKNKTMPMNNATSTGTMIIN